MTNHNAPLPPGARIIGYARDSGGDTQGESVDQQVGAYTAYCAQHGYLLIHVYADRARPGSTTVGRTDFEAMLAALRADVPPCDGVLTWKTNRLAREPRDAAFFKAELRRRGYTLIFLADDIPANLGDAEGIYEALLDWKAKRDLHDISTDVKRGLAAIVSRQRPDGTYEGFAPGKPPTCYKRQPVVIGRRRNGEEHRVSRWVPDPDTWPLGQQAWTMRAGGASLDAIHAATHLFRNIASYSAFFANRIYLGEFEFGGEIYRNFVPALCTPAQWEAVAALRDATVARAPQRHPRRIASNFLLSGLAYCPRCNAMLRGETSGTNKWRAYACPGCSATRYSAAAMERAIVDNLLETVLTPAQLADLQNSLHTAEARALTATTLAARKKSKTACNRAIRNLLDLIENGTITGDAARARLAERETELAQLTTEIAQLEHKLNTAPTPLTAPQLAQLTEQLRTELLSGDPQRAKRVIAAFVIRIVPESKERLQATIAFPRSFEFLTTNNTHTGDAPIGTHPKDVLTLTLATRPRQRTLPHTDRDDAIFYEHYICGLTLAQVSEKHHLTIARVCQILKRIR